MPECPANVRTSSATAPRLRRVLTLWDLIFYGIVLIQPIAPVPLYGVAEKLSNGHFVTTILIAMFAMMITAFSYGRMAAIYPSAGSAYTYVGKGLNPHLGFLIGWAMLLDYILQPLITTIWMATSFAALTYIGFDGVTTLAEDVENPKRNVLLATVLVCLFTGVFGGLEVYLGQRVWPDWHTFPDLVTAFMDVCRRVGGMPLFQAMGAVIMIAALGSGLTGTLGAARLLFGMGRDNVLPRKVFAHLKPESNTPTYNILIISALAYAGAIGLNYIGNAYEHAGELMNFGAFLAFMGVNLATFWQFGLVRRLGYKRRLLADAALPLLGFTFCALIWWNLNIVAKIVGGIWFAIGFAYVLITTRGFRTEPVMIDFSES